MGDRSGMQGAQESKDNLIMDHICHLITKTVTVVVVLSACLLSMSLAFDCEFAKKWM